MSHDPFQSFAIVPAAGRSRRMGEPKLLLPWGSATIIEQVLAAWRSSRVTRTVVVTHPADEALQTICRRAGADVLSADPPPEEMKESVRRGLQLVRQSYAPTARDVWLLAPADLPLLSPMVIDALLAAHDPARPAILVPTQKGRRGHPVLFPWELAAEVERLPADAGVNRLLQGFTVREIACPVSESNCDLDTPEEYQRLRARHDAEGSAP